MRWLLYLLSSISVWASDFKLPAVNVVPSTNDHGHITFAWDTLTNAQWYSVIVRSNGVETQRRYSMTNSVVVSNIFLPLDQYRFTAIATNWLGESDETSDLPNHLTTLTDQWSTNLIDWQTLNTNVFVPELQKQFFRISISNFDSLIFWNRD